MMEMELLLMMNTEAIGSEKSHSVSGVLLLRLGNIAISYGRIENDKNIPVRAI